MSSIAPETSIKVNKALLAKEQIRWMPLFPVVRRELNPENYPLWLEGAKRLFYGDCQYWKSWARRFCTWGKPEAVKQQKLCNQILIAHSYPGSG